jgi:sugar (pentulose or hexulose) kinase
MARNTYFLKFLGNVLGKTVLVPSSTDLTALGTARMALRGAGASGLPPLPPPKRIEAPDAGFGEEARARFGQAVARARSWKTV